MRRSITTLALIFSIFLSFAQNTSDYYLPQNVSYNPGIPTPEAFFNIKPGEWHLTHDQVMYYAKEIARLSDRCIMYEYARSWENRPLVHLVFTSTKNQDNLEELKKMHYDFSEPGSDIAKEDVPLVVSLTYGVHGNESSATNSSILTAYYLAAAQGEKIDKMLANTIVIVDPCMNPDGFTRHSTWANMHQSYMANGDGNSRQFDEVWPGGRTNHYWFDLNRDYLLLVHPESVGKIKMFHEWKPNIVTDHHEMGANSTFFFQPGVPSRNNPLTPQKNYELTHEIARYHAQALDEIGSTYFSEEQFDDYYFGKGSSYPDINGSIGILFEQAGYRGRIRETVNGTMTLASGIKNQFTVSLSTLEAAGSLRNDLLELQKEFYTTALEDAAKSKVKAYIFGDEKDQIKTQYFVDFLNQHQINVYSNTGDLNINGQTFKAGTSFIVPVEQKQYRLITTLFEEVSSFADTTFYDVSTWTFTHALNMKHAVLYSVKNKSEQAIKAGTITGKIIGGKSNLAYVFRWNEYTSANALYKIQESGLRTKVATKEFAFNLNEKEERFSYGTILVPVHGQNQTSDQIFNLLKTVAKDTGIDIYGLTTGLSPSGIDLGSGSFAPLKKPKILMYVGDGIRSSDAGEIWHLLDQRYHMHITLSEGSRLKYNDLSRYNTIILTGGSSYWQPSDIQKLKDWITEGGNLIAYKRAGSWAATAGIGKTKFKKPVKSDTSKYINYIERRKERSLNYIGGAIFNAELDITHPLCYGYFNATLPIFKTSATVAESLETKYSEPVKYSSTPYISGWASDGNIDRIRNAPLVSVQKIGKGKLISYHDNMNFRGIWLGTSKLFSNSLFFGSVIQ